MFGYNLFFQVVTMHSLKKFVVAFLFFFQAITLSAIEPTLTINIPMRDGKELPTDLYMPSPDAKGLPCILLRSPAGRKAATAQIFTPYIQEGYLVAIQDTRSAVDPEGKTHPYQADGWGKLQDGYDTVQWLADSCYTNGKIATAGWSAMGITQLMMGPSAPPGLKCQFIGVATPSMYHYAIFEKGCFKKNMVEGWLGMCAKHPSVLETVVANTNYLPFWEQFDAMSQAGKAQAPALHQSGWYDIFTQGTIDAFVTLQERGGPGARGNQKLLIGPWTHFWPCRPDFGDCKVPEEGKKVSIADTYSKLFAYYLKDDQNGYKDLPPVTYYVMGPFDGTPSSGNVWRTSHHWPIPARSTPFFLTNKNELSETTSTDHKGSIAYTYTANDPVPTVGGSNLFIESGPKDQRKIEERSDVISFTSQPLQEDLEVTGRIFAVLYLTADQPAGDVAVRLTDVYPDGKSVLLLDGIAHLGDGQSEKFDSKKPVEVWVDLWTTSIVFAKGHQIRISVSGSNYPKFEKAVGLENGNNSYTLYTGPDKPSHIVLPIVRKGERWLIAEQPQLKK